MAELVECRRGTDHGGDTATRTSMEDVILPVVLRHAVARASWGKVILFTLAESSGFRNVKKEQRG